MSLPPNPPPEWSSGRSPEPSSGSSELSAAVPLVFRGATELASMIAKREVTSQQLVDAMIARVEQVNPQINALVVPLFSRARREAEQADAAVAANERFGPLHGVPVTIKECFFVAGTPATIGLTHLQGKRSSEDGLPVARMRAAGAIVLGKTNLPQLMILHESDNPLYGQTNNPWELGRTPGGSSGGEGAIVAAGGSPLGLGNDLGGSIRIPAHFCGVYGLKPTSRRLPMTGSFENFIGMEAVDGQPGPIARNVDDLELGLRVLHADQSLPRSDTTREGCSAENDRQLADERVAPLAWQDSATVEVERLRVGIYTDDGFFPPSPAVARGVTEAGARLRARGIEVVEFRPPEVEGAMAIYFGLLTADGAAGFRQLLRGSQVDRRVAQLCRRSSMRRIWRRPLAALLASVGQHRLAKMLPMGGPRSAQAYWALVAQRDAYRQQFLAAMETDRLDALICPPHALPALKHRRSSDLVGAASYSMLFNLLGNPAGTVPVSVVKEEETNLRQPGRDAVDRLAASTDRGSQGLPLGVQVVGRHWREDVVLALMRVIGKETPERFPLT